jgi:hypothetical protein
MTKRWIAEKRGNFKTDLATCETFPINKHNYKNKFNK